MKEGNASRSGMCYSSATGQPIPNLGEQCIPLLTMESTFRGMTFQAAPVSKFLGSAKRICAAAHRLGFEDGASYIKKLATGEINMLREEHDNYMLEMWVVPPQTTERRPMPSNAPPSVCRQR